MNKRFYWMVLLCLLTACSVAYADGGSGSDAGSTAGSGDAGMTAKADDYTTPKAKKHHKKKKKKHALKAWQESEKPYAPAGN